LVEFDLILILAKQHDKIGAITMAHFEYQGIERRKFLGEQ